MKGEREGEGKGEGWGWVKIRVRVRVPPVLLHLALEASQLDLDPTLLAGEALAQKEARLATVAAPDRGGRSETRPSSLLGLAWRVDFGSFPPALSCTQREYWSTSGRTEFLVGLFGVRVTQS